MQLIGVNDPKAIRKYSGLLAVDVPRTSFWGSKFTSRGKTPKAPIQRLDELEDEKGDKIQFDLRLAFRGEPTEGDDIAEDSAEDLKFGTDVVYIDQFRHAADTGGKMSKKRTMHDLRALSKEGLQEWFARAIDELHFIYLSGSRGVNDDFVWRLGYPGFAGNPITAPDTLHLMYGGDATSKSSLASDDGFTKLLLDRIRTKIDLIGGGTKHQPSMNPIKVNGEDKYAIVMSPHQEHSLRNDAGSTGWFEITKALTTSAGRDSPMWKNALGEYRDMVLHKHKAVIRFNDYGAGGTTAAARALVLGRQAGLVAYGNAGTGVPYNWNEETKDGKNRLLIFGGVMMGIKKSTFKIPTTGETLDFGVLSVDTYIDTTLGA